MDKIDVTAVVISASVWTDLKDVWDKAGKMAALVTLPTLSLAALVNKLLEPVLTLGEIVVLTWPLVISATILAMIAYRRWRGPPEPFAFGHILLIAMIIVWPFLIAALFGLEPRVGFGFSDEVRTMNPLAQILLFLPGAAADIIAAYFSSWGISRTLSAIACGIFLAWVFDAKILPRVRKGNTAL